MAWASCGSVVVDSLLIVATIVCGGFVFGSHVVVQCLMSFLVLQSSHWGGGGGGGG